MNVQLMPQLLDFLKIQGFRYCLSQTCLSGANDDQVIIQLKPVKSKPNISQLPNGYDTFNHINFEPKLMANSFNDTFIDVILDAEIMTLYFAHVMSLKSTSLIGKR